MTVDLEAIARRSGSELSSLKLALPLLEQGFSPPFLARYRRDELSGVSERALWHLMRALKSEKTLHDRREELTKLWQRTRLADPSLQKAIRQAKSKSAASRVARRLKSEPTDPAATIPPEVWVASRLLNPEPGDPGDVAALAEKLGHADQLERINRSLDQALAKRLADHPQIQATAVRWLNAHAGIRFVEVSDPNLESRPETEATHLQPAERPETEPGAHWPSPEELSAKTASPASKSPADESSQAETQSAEAASDATAAQGSTVPEGQPQSAASESAAQESAAQESPTGESAATDAGTAGETAPAEAGPPQTATGDASGAAPTNASSPEQLETSAGEQAAAPAADRPPAAETQKSEPAPGAVEPAGGQKTAALQKERKKKSGGKAKQKPIVKQTKILKKMSPRQRRRRWLIGILQPLVGKQIPVRDLSAFQTLILNCGLRANLVRCQFVYDAAQLVGQLKKAASQLNPAFADRLAQVVNDHEAAIREAAELVWWEELRDTGTGRLIDLTGEHLEKLLHRGAVEAQTVLAIDAVGPRTSPVSIVSGDGRLLHTEDIASQLDSELRTASVTRLGELIHRFGVDLIVISNGPARRTATIILGELIAQSPEGSVRWTMAERSGADAYAGCELADREMKATPRRFRAAAWLAFSLLKPAWALAKVDPMKLRLSSAQRELPNDQLAPALHDVMTSAVSRGGLDVNSAPVDSLAQLPGVTRSVAQAIDRRRREELFPSREEVLSLEEWPDEMHSRQAIGFLRVFGGSEPLDATVIHPEDYSLARKLAKALNLELPPSAPPGYVTPTFDDPTPAVSEKVAAEPQTADASAGEAATPFAPELTDESPAEASPPEVADQASGESDSAAAATDEQAMPAAGEPQAAAEASSPEQAATEAPATESGDAEAKPEATAEPGDPAAEQPDAEATAGDPSESPQPEAGSPETTSEAPEPQAADTTRQPLPEPAAINKCIREWQIGSSRTHRIVHALCDPFGEEVSATPGDAPATMTKLPKASELKPGDRVVGVVAGVASFGAFVEITPELTGLVRVSRLAEEYVEEIHDYVQVGDVMSGWVSEIDSRRRLQVSAISPEREEELRQQRQAQREQRRGPRGGPGRGGPGRGRGPRAADRDAAPAAAGSGSGGSDARGGERRDGGRRGGKGAPAGAPGGGRRGGSRDDRRGQGRGRDARGRRDEPSSYTTRVPKNQPPAPPISDAMVEGKEPMRTFGDLLQFFKKDQPSPPAPGGTDSGRDAGNKAPHGGKSHGEKAGEDAPPPEVAASENTASEPQEAKPVQNSSDAAGESHREPPPVEPARQAPTEPTDQRHEPTPANDNSA